MSARLRPCLTCGARAKKYLMTPAGVGVRCGNKVCPKGVVIAYTLHALDGMRWRKRFRRKAMSMACELWNTMHDKNGDGS